MKIEQEKTMVLPVTGSENRRPTTRTNQNWISSKFVKNLAKQLPESTPCFVARAPGRLNVMGGITDYTGSLVLNIPSNDLVTVALQLRSQKEIALLFDGQESFILPRSQFEDAQKNPVSARDGKRLVQGNQTPLPRCIFGVLVELRRAQMIPDFPEGLTIVVGRNHSGIYGAAEHVSAASAVMVAVAALLGASLKPLEAARVCQKVQNDWLDWPVGISDALCTLQGEPYTICGIRSDTYARDGSICLPESVRIVGVDCGVMSPEADTKYRRVRTASFMGRSLIDRIIQHDGAMDMQWNGYLSCVSVTDFVERFRDRLPTKIRGREFLDRFGETGDPLTTIEPKIVYKIRSRTEHHIYEHTRCRQLMECLFRMIRSGDPNALVDAQAIMYASHWSYGQRCGLGSIETDLLVNLIRRHGTGSNIFGAKVSAHGCGGVVTVLMQTTDKAHAALDRAINDYVEQTGLRVTVINDSTPGALNTGAHQLLL